MIMTPTLLMLSLRESFKSRLLHNLPAWRACHLQRRTGNGLALHCLCSPPCLDLPPGTVSVRGRCTVSVQPVGRAAKG